MANLHEPSVIMLLRASGYPGQSGQGVAMQYALGMELGATRTVAAVSLLPPPSDEIDQFPEPPAPSLFILDTRSLITSARPVPARASRTSFPRATLSLSEPELDYVAARFLARVGDPIPMLGRPELAAELIAAHVIGAAVETVAAQVGGSPDSLVIAHPGSWHQHRRQLLLRALEEFGLERCTLLARPVLAALRYAEQTGMEIGDSVVTVDMGARAAEAALVRRSAIDTFEIVGRVHEEPACGGLAFDEALTAHLMPKARRDVTARARDELTAWRDEVHAAKEALSSSPEVMIPKWSGTGSERMTRTEFEVLVSPALQRLTELVEKVSSASPTSDHAAAIAVVGGAARVPAIPLALADTLAPPVVVDNEPHVAVAAGAAVAAWFLALEDGDIAEVTRAEEPESATGGLRRLLSRRPRDAVMRRDAADTVRAAITANKWQLDATNSVR